MAYNAPRPLTPNDIPELALVLDRNLHIAHLRLEQFKVDPTITRDQAQTGVAFFAEVIAQNEHHTTLIKGWLRLGRIPKGQVSKARRLIGVMDKINRLVEKLSIMAAKLAESGPVRPPILCIMPLSDLADLIVVTDQNIVCAREDIKSFASAAAAPFPFFTRRELLAFAVRYRDALAVTKPFPQQYRRWRRQSLTALQRRQISYLARRVRIFRKLMETGLDLMTRLSGKTIDDLPQPDPAGYLHGLVEDHPMAGGGNR